MPFERKSRSRRYQFFPDFDTAGVPQRGLRLVVSTLVARHGLTQTSNSVRHRTQPVPQTVAPRASTFPHPSSRLLIPETSPLRTHSVEVRRSRTRGRSCWFFSQTIQAQGTDLYKHLVWKPRRQTLAPRLKPKTLRCNVSHLFLSRKGGACCAVFLQGQTRYGAYHALP